MRLGAASPLVEKKIGDIFMMCAHMVSIRFWIATWFNTGLLKGRFHIGGGTWGSIFALPLCCLFVWLDNRFQTNLVRTVVWIFALGAVLVIGAFSVPVAETLLGPVKNWQGKIVRHDQNEIVIDEVLGMLVTVMPALYFNIPVWLWPFLGLAFFRFFDVVKVWPTKRFDRWQSPWGVMLDDVVAGIYAAIFLAAFSWPFGWRLPWKQ